MEKLASGIEINRAGDDALRIGSIRENEKQIRGLYQANRKTQKTAYSFIQQLKVIFRNPKTLFTGYENWLFRHQMVFTVTRIEHISRSEVSQLVDEVDRVASHAQFNGMNMQPEDLQQGNRNKCYYRSMWFILELIWTREREFYIGNYDCKSLWL